MSERTAEQDTDQTPNVFFVGDMYGRPVEGVYEGPLHAFDKRTGDFPGYSYMRASVGTLVPVANDKLFIKSGAAA